MGLIKIDTETGEVIERSEKEPEKSPEKQEEMPDIGPQPTVQEITEDMLRREKERRERKEKIIGNLTPEQLEELIQRNRIGDLLRKKPEIGNA